MTSVQLIGKPAVLGRFQKLDCEAWALYQGKQFIVGGTGADTLGDWLHDLETSGSTATYVLRVYDSEDTPTSSTGNSDYIACINFKVVDIYEGGGIAGRNDRLMETIRGIQTEIKELRKPAESEEPEGETIGSVIMDWLQNPEKLGIVVGIARQIFGTVTPIPIAQPVQAIAGLTNPNTQVENSSEEGLQRIAKALDVLGECDPQLVVHLEKLAKLAKEEPVLFKSVIGKLDLL